MEFQWETLCEKEGIRNYFITQRAKVIGGWIVRTNYIDNEIGTSESQSFIPDPSHQWGKSLMDGVE